MCLLACSVHCMPYLDSSALLPARATGWVIDARYEATNECPAGQRTAKREECLSAVQEAAQRESVQVNTVKFVDQGAGESVPAGCSYNVVTQDAAFNKNPAGRSDKPWSNKLVCVDDVSEELAVNDWSPAGKPFQCHSRPHCDLGGARAEPTLSGAFEIAANKSIHFSKLNGCRVVTYTVALLDPEHKKSKASSPPPGSEGCAFAFVHDVSAIHPLTNSSSQWMPIVVPMNDLPWPVASVRRNARVPKLLPHLFFPQSVEATVFVDADSSLKIKRGIAGIVQNMLTDCGASFAALAHATRFTDVMTEFDDLRSSGTVADPANLDLQEHVYRADEDYMAAVNSGRAVAVDGQLLVRRNANPQSRHLDVAWMRAFVRGADRDLPAFSYALEKSGLAACRARIGEEGYGQGRCGLGCGQGAINLVGSPRSADCLGQGVTEYCTDQPEGTWGRCSKVKARPSWATVPPPWVCNALTDKAGVGVGDASADAHAPEAPAPADASADAPAKPPADAYTPADKPPVDASGAPADDAYANAPGPVDAPAPATGGPTWEDAHPSEAAPSRAAPSGVTDVLPPLVAPGAVEVAAAGAEAAVKAAAKAAEENMKKAAAIAKKQTEKIASEQENQRKVVEKQHQALKDMEAKTQPQQQQQQQQQQSGRTEEQQAAAQRIGGGQQSWPAPQQQQQQLQQPPVEKMAVASSGVSPSGWAPSGAAPFGAAPSGAADVPPLAAPGTTASDPVPPPQQEVTPKVVPLNSPEAAAAAAVAKVAEANAAAAAAGIEAAAAAEVAEDKATAEAAAAEAAAAKKKKQQQQQQQTAAAAAAPEGKTVPAPNYSNWPEAAAKAAAKAAEGDAAAAAAAAEAVAAAKVAEGKAVAEAAAAAKVADKKKAADAAANVAKGEALTKAAAAAAVKVAEDKAAAKVAEEEAMAKDQAVAEAAAEAAEKAEAVEAAAKAKKQKEQEKTGCVDWCYGEEHAGTSWTIRCAWESGERGGCHGCPPCQKVLPAHPA